MSDKKEKDSKVKSSKAKKTVVCLTVPSGTLLIRNFDLQKN